MPNWKRTIFALLVAAATAEAQTPVMNLVGASAFDGYGRSAAFVGDLDNDGRRDLLVAAPDKAIGTANYVGQVDLVSGATGAVILSLFGTDAFENFGQSVADAGDFDYDGIPDFVIGAPGARQNNLAVGAAFVYSGSTGQLFASFWGTSYGDRFGASVDGVGDINGDGIGDIVAGAHQYQLPSPILPNPSPPGYIRIIAGVTGLTLYALSGDAADDAFGAVVAGVGDVDGDGVPDFAAAAKEYRAPLPGAPVQPTGYVKVFSGFTGVLIRQHQADAFGDDFGFAVEGVGDLDADGLAEVAIGSPFFDGATANSGGVRVFSGATGLRIFTLDGANQDDNFGRSLASAGDVDGDGVNDIGIGIPGSDVGVVDSGAYEVHSGATGAILSTVQGTTPSDFFARTLASSGDRFRLFAAAGVGGFAAPGHLDVVDLGPALLPVIGAGNVGVTAGGPYDLLTVNGFTGWTSRRVDLAIGEPLAIFLAQPPTTPLPANFILWATLGVADQASAFPTNWGTMAFAPYHAYPYTPWLFTMANSFGPDPFGTLAPASWPTPWMYALGSGVPYAISVTLQALIQDGSAPGGVAFTNAVAVQVQ